MAPGGSHTRQLGPSEDHMEPLELGRGLGVEKAEQSEADPAGPAISSLPSFHQSLRVVSVGEVRITGE